VAATENFNFEAQYSRWEREAMIGGFGFSTFAKVSQKLATFSLVFHCAVAVAAPMEPTIDVLLGGGKVSAPEAYAPEPLPPGIQVQQTAMEGPVFADTRGSTLYIWESQAPGLGAAMQGCDNHIVTQSSSGPTVRFRNVAGYRYYPEGTLPEADKRVPCAKIWPPVAAPADAVPVGRWTIFVRADGYRQWAFRGYPVYTSNQDHAPGDVNGGSIRIPVYAHQTETYVRKPIGPEPDVPAGFSVSSTPVGRLLITDGGAAVFMSDKDPPGKSHCITEACNKTWVPQLAPQMAKAKGKWSFISRGQGVRQWAYEGKPLYTYSLDEHIQGLKGAEVPGWRPVIVKALPDPPSWLTVKDTEIGTIYADSAGKSLYYFHCNEPADGELHCDTPDTPQAYRLWYCGYNDVERCLKTWPPVLASAQEKSLGAGAPWSIIWIDRTGRRATADQPGAMRVWAFRGRPVYTYAGDKTPADVNGDGIGEKIAGTMGFLSMRVRATELYPYSGN
jgi:predicted lipoprotein with Yx(FWY)xxD motif